MACLRDNPTPEKSTVLLAFLIFLSLLSSCKHQERQTSETTQSANGSPSRLSLESPTPESKGLRASTSKRKVFKTGEAVPVSYLGYKVNDSWFVNDGTGTSEGSTQKHKLYVDLAVVNTDRKERAVPLLKLVDEGGTEYETGGKSGNTKANAGPFGQLSPATSKRDKLIFAVPRNRSYKLKIQDGSPVETVLIELSPSDQAPD